MSDYSSIAVQIEDVVQAIESLNKQKEHINEPPMRVFYRYDQVDTENPQSEPIVRVEIVKTHLFYHTYFIALCQAVLSEWDDDGIDIIIIRKSIHRDWEAQEWGLKKFDELYTQLQARADIEPIPDADTDDIPF